MQKIVGKSLKPCRERYTYQLARRYFHRHQQYWHDFQMFSHQMLTFTLYSKCLKQIIQLRNYYGSTNFPVHLEPWHHCICKAYVCAVCAMPVWPMTGWPWLEKGRVTSQDIEMMCQLAGVLGWFIESQLVPPLNHNHVGMMLPDSPFHQDDLEPRFAVGIRCFPRWNVKPLP